MQEGRMPSGMLSGEGGLDPAKMLSSMKGKDIKQMLKAAKENPEVLKSAVPNGDTSAMEGLINRLEGLDEKTLDWIVSILSTIAAAVQPLWRGYTSLNQAMGGHLLTVVIGIPVGLLLYRWFGPSDGGSVTGSSTPSISEEVASPVPEIEESEFAEF